MDSDYADTSDTTSRHAMAPTPGPGADWPDLDLCAREPIHRPGTVQGRGVLLVLEGAALRISRVSDNCQSVLGRPADALLERGLADVLGAPLAQRVEQALQRWRRSGRQPAHFHWAPAAAGMPGGPFAGFVHESAGAVLLELEPELAADASTDESASGELSAALIRFSDVRAEPNLDAKLAAAAVQLRELTGYDRVMIYRFDADWHGEVVAEARRDDLLPYLGLHYPATDVPEQARRLYRISPTRVIDDIYAEAARLMPAPPPTTADGDPLDLSLSVLRSVSPVHLEYLHNMGVRATMTASLVHDDRLWGLIACHHYTPRRLPQRLRELTGWLAEDLATQVVLCETQHSRRYADRLKASRDAVIGAMRRGARLADLITGPALDDVLNAIGGGGVALVHEGNVVAGGRTPPPAQILAIKAQLGLRMQEADGAQPESLFITDCLSDHLDWTAALADVAAGIVIEPLSADARMVLIWFRGEQLRHVTWGGDPDKAAAVDADGRISPRRSFAAWKQIVECRSLPWSAEEIASARELATLIDIEQRREAEQAARDTEAKLRSMLDNSPAAIYIKDLRGRYLLVNRCCEALLGVTNAELAGKTPDEALPPQTAATFKASDQALLATLTPQRVEETIDTPKGPRTLLSSQFPLRDDAGEVTAICGISVDITERLRMERELTVALAKYQALFQSFPLGITVSDDEGRIIETNPASEQILAVPEDEHLVRSIHGPEWTILRPDESLMDPSEYASVRALTERELVRDQEMIFQSPAGDRRWLGVSAAPLDVAGLGAVVVYEDITQRKAEQARRQAGAAMRESERRFRTLVNELPVMVWGDTADGRSLLINKTYCEFVGRSEADLLGEGWHDIIHPDDRAAYFGLVERSIRARRSFTGECRVRRADGAWRWVEASARFVGDSPFGYVGVARDITERKAAQEALQASHRELQHRTEQLGWLTSQLTLAEQHERERLAKVLHDHLQQLLVSALFGIDRVERRLGEPQPGSGVTEALTSVKEVMQDAIDAARTLVADLSPPILHEAGLAEAMGWLARAMLEHYGLRVELRVDENPPPVRDDMRILLFESVREALFNIVKHAACDEAEVALERDGDRGLRITVSDRGKGFDPARLRKDQVQLRATGFGLLSMHERLRFLGGACHVDSVPGQGTRLVLTAPLEPVGAVAAQPADADTAVATAPVAAAEALPSAGAPLRILLVDDHAVMREGLSMLLEDEPDLDIVGQAADGVEALEQVERLRPDLVLMDFSMPRMDGLEATRRICHNWPEVRIIGLSMYQDEDRAEAMREAGASAYVTKTAGRDALMDAIRAGKTRPRH